MLKLPDPPGWPYFICALLLMAVATSLPSGLASSWIDLVSTPLVVAPLFAEIAFIPHARLQHPRVRRLQRLQLLCMLPALVVVLLVVPDDWALLGAGLLALVQLPLMWMVFRTARQLAVASEEHASSEADAGPRPGLLGLADPPGWWYFLGTLGLFAAVSGLPPGAESWQDWLTLPLVAAPIFAEIAFIPHARLQQRRTRLLQVLQILILVPALVVLAVAAPADFDALLGTVWLTVVQLPLMWMVFRAARQHPTEEASAAEEAEDTSAAEPAEQAPAAEEAQDTSAAESAEAPEAEAEGAPPAEDDE